MSQTIDKRVVEMRFDNKQFEDGVKQSLGTLDKLKNILHKDISSKSIDNISKSAKNVDLSGLIDGVNNLNQRFSALGIVGMEVIRNITDGLMGGLSRGIHAATDAIVSGGIKRAMNIENAHFQLQGLIEDETEVQAVMQDAMDSVDGTAYAYDEAAKAASMFAASGLKSGEQMQMSLKAIAGTAATTNAEYSRVADIFTKIAGKGKVQAEELNQFASMGMNAAAAVTKYFNSVNDGTTEASEGVTSAIKDLTNGLEVSEADIREWASKSKISFEVFTEAMGKTFGDHAKDANETFTGSMANIRAALARTGAMFVSPLISQNGPLVKFFNAVRIKVNEFNKALGAANGIAGTFTNWINRMVERLTPMVENFKIANTYVKTFADGTTKTFEGAHKQIQDFGNGMKETVKGDFYTPFHALKDIIITISYLFKGLWSVIKPIGQAFRDVFAFKDHGLGLYKTIEAIRQFASHLALSKQNSEDLRKAFTGLFSIVKSVGMVIGKFIKALIPGEMSAGSFGDAILALSGKMGEGLSQIAEWIDTSPELEAAFNAVHTASTFMAKSLGQAFDYMERVIRTFDVRAELNNLSIWFNNISNELYNMMPSWMQNALNTLESTFTKIGNDLANFNLEALKKDLIELGEQVRYFGDEVLHLDEIKDKFIRFFDFSNEESGISKLKSKFDDFVTWFKSTVVPIFDGVSFGGLLATGGGLYILFRVGQVLGGLASLFSGAGHVLNEVPGTLKSIKGAIKAYQHDLNANALIKVAAAIAILAGSIWIIAQIDDPKKLKIAAVTIGILAGAFLLALGLMTKIPKKMVTIADALKSAGTKLAKALNQALSIKAVGSMVKDIAIAIGLIVASIAGVMYLKGKDEIRFNAAVDFIKDLGVKLLIVAGVGTLIGTVFKDGAKNFGIAAVGALALVLAIIATIGALKLLMDMELPSNYEEKLKILHKLFIGVGVLAIAFGVANKLAGSGSLKIGKGGLESTGGGMSAAPILALCALLYTSVLAVKKVMDMQMPSNYKERLGVISHIFGALIIVILAMGAASRLAGDGGIKAGAEILSICLYVYAIIGALKVLGSFNGHKLKKGLLALAGILYSLAFTLMAAGTIQDKGAGLAVLSMSLLVAAIVFALGVLSMIKGAMLAKGATALGSVLLILAVTFAAVGKITNGNSFKSVLAMAGVIAVITGSLLALTKWGGEWKQIVSSAVAIGSVLYLLGNTFRKLSGSNADPKKMLKKVGNFLLLGLALAEIAIALTKVSQYNWKQIAAAGAAISLVLLTYTDAFAKVSKVKDIDYNKIGMFLLGALSLWVIGSALMLVADFHWDSLLGAGAAIGLCLIAYAEAFQMINSVGTVDGSAIGAFLLGSVATLVIGKAIQMIAEFSWQSLLASATAISECLLAIAGCIGILTYATAGMDGKGIAMAAGVMLVGVLAIAAIGFVLAVASHFDWAAMSGVANVMTSVLNSIAITIGILVTVSGILITATEGLGALGLPMALGIIFIGLLGLAGIAYILAEMSAYPYEQIEGTANALTSVLKNLTGCMAVLTIIGIAAPAAVAGIFLLDAFIADFAAVLLALGKLREIPGFDDLIKSGGGALNQIGKSIGEFVGSIIEAVGGSIGKTLETIGTNLSNFMINSEGFFDGLKKFDNTVLQGMAVLTGVIIALTAADMIAAFGSLFDLATNGFFKLLTGNDSGFEAQLKRLGEAMSGFYEEVKGIDNPGAFQAVAKGCQYLVEMTSNIPNSGGLAGVFAGNNDADEWGRQVYAMGVWMTNLSYTIRGVDFSNFPSFATNTQALIDMCATIANSGGVAADWLGDNKPDEWGSQVYSLGRSMVNLSKMITGVVFDSFEPFATAVQCIVDMCGDIENSGGALGALAGNNDPDTWGQKVYSMARHLKNTVMNIAGVDFSVLKPFSENIQYAVAASNEMIGLNPMYEVDVDTWATKLESLGWAISKYEASIQNISDISKLISVSRAIPSLKDALESLQGFVGKTKGIDNFSAALERLAQVGIDNFITAFAQTEQVASAIQGFMDASIGEIEKYYKRFSTAGEESGKNYVKGLSSQNKNAIDAAKKLALSAINALTSMYYRFKNIGQMSATNYASGLQMGATQAATAAMAMASAAANNMNPVDDKGVSLFYKQGVNAAEGYLKGLQSKLSDIKKVGAEMAKAAESGTSKQQQSKSPAKKFIKQGGYAGEGYVIGILQWAKDAYDAGKELAKVANAGVEDLLITDPVIKPLVDLSNVSESADLINSMFNSAIEATSSRTSAVITSANASSSNNSSNGFQNGQQMYGNNYTFVQNNNSPKALSRVDIYRQTNRQFQQFREVVDSV
jgi:hypothetical protein